MRRIKKKISYFDVECVNVLTGEVVKEEKNLFKRPDELKYNMAVSKETKIQGLVTTVKEKTETRVQSFELFMKHSTVLDESDDESNDESDDEADGESVDEETGEKEK